MYEQNPDWAVAPDPEVKAMAILVDALEGIKDDRAAVERVLEWARDRYLPRLTVSR